MKLDLLPEVDLGSPGPAVPQLQLPENGIMFQTSHGSKYVWDSKSRSSTRWKSFHGEHGKNSKTGLQGASQFIIFIKSDSGLEFADVINWREEKRFIFYTTKSGKLYLHWSDKTWSDPIDFGWEPVVGLYPIEFWKIQNLGKGTKNAGKVHLGNEIVKVSREAF